MGDSNMEAASVSHDIVRLLFSTLDRPAYWLLGLVYQLFFNVASADLFSNGTIMSFYKRVQLIIGVFMMFQLAMTILKGIMNPDSFTDSKNGAANLVKRVAISLILLTVLVPINIPGARNEWERQLNNNGLLFGALYSLQHRILDNNTLGRLILGTNDSSESFTESDPDDNDSSLAKSSRVFTATILKGFYRINLLPEEDRPKHEEGKDDATFNDNRVCKDIDQELLNAYTRLDADPNDIISMVRASCEDENAEQTWYQKIVSIAQPKLGGKNKYVFAYMPLVSAIVPFIFVFILLSFTIDVAVRAVKLAVLRLIAPIPIISYMDPKGSKDSSFNSWVKSLTSTYLDLFIRLAVVYFVIYLIQDMIVNGIVINVGSGVLGILSMIIIWIGLFIFAKQAPKFIKQVLGMKDDGGKIFGNLGAALGLGAAAVGSIGAFKAGMDASRMADETRKSMGENVDPTSLTNRGKHLLSGIAGGAMGFGTGVGAALSAKDHALKNTFDAIQKRNAQSITAGDSGSTFLGRARAGATRLFTGDGPGASVSREISTMESRKKALDAVKKRASGEMVKQMWTKGSFSKNQSYDVNGNAIGNVNYKSFMAAKKAAEAAGQSTVTFQDADNSSISYTVDMTTANMNEGWILKQNESSYISEVVAGHQDDGVLKELIDDAEKRGGTYTYDSVAKAYVDTHGKVVDRDSVTKSSDELEKAITAAKRRNIINEQNDRYSSKK